MRRRDVLRAFAWATVATLAPEIPEVERIVEAAAASKRALSGGLYTMPLGGRYGYIDARGAVIIAPEYETTYGFHDGLAFYRANGLYGLIDADNRRVTAPVFEAFDLSASFSEGRCGVKRGGKWGFVDRDGAWIVEPTFASIRGYSCGLAAFEDESGWGFVDLDGAIAVPAAFESAYSFREGLAGVKERGGAYGFIDRAGKWAIAPRFAFATRFHEHRAHVVVDGASGYIDPDGREVVPARYKWAKDFSDGRGLVVAAREPERAKDVFYKEQVSALDARGEAVFTLEPGDYVLAFTSGRLGVGRDVTPGAATARRKFGFVDTNGDVVIDFRFDDICVFDELGVAHVVLDGARALIDTSGRVLARVERHADGREQLIDASGKIAWSASGPAPRGGSHAPP